MERYKQLIELVTGNLDAERRMEVLKAIKEDPSLRKDFEEVKNAWALAAANNTMESSLIESSCQRFWQKSSPKKVRLIKLRRVMQYAAVLLVVFMLGLYLGPLNKNRWGNFVGSNLLPAEIRVPNGEKAELTLPDGSRVWLNSGTILRFPLQFGANSRDVQLQGEAFFEVVKGTRPFVVSSRYGDIRVLGTSFNVRAYADLDFQATLVKGKIQFKNCNTQQLLMPGQQIGLTANNQLVLQNVDSTKAISWKNGYISFENEPLSQVMKRLGRHYGIQIFLDEQLSPIRFTGTIYNETITEVMSYIKLTKPINYAYDQKQGTLKIFSR